MCPVTTHVVTNASGDLICHQTKDEPRMDKEFAFRPGMVPAARQIFYQVYTGDREGAAVSARGLNRL